jgi:hypothetical protein
LPSGPTFFVKKVLLVWMMHLIVLNEKDHRFCSRALPPSSCSCKMNLSAAGWKCFTMIFITL